MLAVRAGAGPEPTSNRRNCLARACMLREIIVRSALFVLRCARDPFKRAHGRQSHARTHHRHDAPGRTRVRGRGVDAAT